MGKKYIIDADVINESIASLKKLEARCDEYSKKKLPKFGKDKGNTHDEMVLFMKNINKSFAEMKVLIAKTIEFLGGESKTVTEADKKSAKDLA